MAFSFLKAEGSKVSVNEISSLTNARGKFQRDPWSTGTSTPSFGMASALLVPT